MPTQEELDDVRRRWNPLRDGWPPKPPEDVYTPEQREVRTAFINWYSTENDARGRDFARLVHDLFSPSWRSTVRREAMVKFGILLAVANASPAHRAAMREILAGIDQFNITPQHVALARSAFEAIDDGAGL
jgi:hypothetical protein